MFHTTKALVAASLLASVAVGAQAATVTPTNTSSSVATTSSNMASVNVVLPVKPPSRVIPRAPRVVPSPS